jgi:hypothetical protein
VTFTELLKTDQVKHLGAGILAGILLFGAGYAICIYTRPAEVREHTVVQKVEVEKQVVVVQEKIKVEKVYLQDTKQAIHRETHETSHPDGTVEKFSTEDINTSNVIQSHDIQYVDRDVLKTVEHTTVQEKVIDKIVSAAKPQWHASLLVGMDFKRLDALGTPLPGSLLGKPWILGVHVERRIVGPFFIGAVVTTSQWPLLSVGIEW